MMFNALIKAPLAGVGKQRHGHVVCDRVPRGAATCTSDHTGINDFSILLVFFDDITWTPKTGGVARHTDVAISRAA